MDIPRLEAVVPVAVRILDNAIDASRFQLTAQKGEVLAKRRIGLGVKGLADACTFFDVPVVGGNVSLYNEHGEGAIDPTPVISMVGLIEKAERVTRSFVEQSGQSIILLGGLPNELGGSYFLQTKYGKKEGTCPEVDFSEEKKLYFY